MRNRGAEFLLSAALLFLNIILEGIQFLIYEPQIFSSFLAVSF